MFPAWLCSFGPDQTTYFHPILSCILSSPEKRVLLRWTNIESDASGDKRPDAALTKLIQLSYGPSLGFGEAKVAQPNTNNNDLCHDLLRLGIFCKEAIDTHHWNACLAFQIHGFTIVFYLMRFRHDGIYTMYEIANYSRVHWKNSHHLYPWKIFDLWLKYPNHFGDCANPYLLRKLM